MLPVQVNQYKYLNTNIPAHRLGSGDNVLPAKVYLQPLFNSLLDRSCWAPCSTFEVLVEKKRFKQLSPKNEFPSAYKNIISVGFKSSIVATSTFQNPCCQQVGIVIVTFLALAMCGPTLCMSKVEEAAKAESGMWPCSIPRGRAAQPAGFRCHSFTFFHCH